MTQITFRGLDRARACESARGFVEADPRQRGCKFQEVTLSRRPGAADWNESSTTETAVLTPRALIGVVVISTRNTCAIDRPPSLISS